MFLQKHFPVFWDILVLFTSSFCSIMVFIFVFSLEKISLQSCSSYITLQNYHHLSCLLFVYTALCWHDLNTTALLWICKLSPCFVLWKQGGACWSFGPVLWNVSCFICRLFCVSFSSLLAVVDRVDARTMDKWGQEQRSLGPVSLSRSEFSTNMGWKDSSSLRHSNTAERHNDISIGQETEREEKEERVSVSVWESELPREITIK